MYRESYMSNRGDESDRKMVMNVQAEDTTPENPVINWIKIMTLFFGTYGLVVLIWVISNAIEHMKSDQVLTSYLDAGGLILGMFLFYLIAFAIAWYCGYQKRDQIRREVVEKQIAKERALQALNNIE